MTNLPLKIALDYIKRGWNPVPVSRRTKKPIGLEWQKCRLTSETAPDYFNGGDVNVGVQLGDKSNGLTDVDLDGREALVIGPLLLPKTNNIFGRKSKPRSHWLYVTGLAETISKACLQFKDIDGTMMLELRIGGAGKGSQSVFPGSVHESGELIEWAEDGVPVTVDDAELLQCVQRIGVATLVARHWPAEGGRHDAALTVGGFLARAGLDEDAAALMLEAIATAAGDEEVTDRVQAARDSVKQYGNGGETRGFPALAETFGQKVAHKAAKWLGYAIAPRKLAASIEVRAGELPRVVDEAERALLASGCEIYQRGLLVRPAIVPLKASDNRDTQGWRLIQVVQAYLVDIMTRSASFVRWDARRGKLVPTDAPTKVAATYLARAGEWKVPVLSGIVNTPFLRTDGSICQDPGYDVRSGLLFKPCGQTFPPIPQSPSKDDAVNALARLRAPLQRFPFNTDADEAVALSGILTAIDRRALPTAPLHGFDAPVAGTGKSKLVDIVSTVATGYDAPVIAQGRTEEELEKRLNAALLAGDAIISIDNCSHPLEGAFLCMMLTPPRVKVRILGKSEQPELPSNAFVSATGNGLTFVGDLTRRSLRCRIDARMERPELRQFDFDPVAVAREERGQLVAAGLTVLRAYLASDERVQVEPFGSFEDWSRRVREALIWLGCDDPCNTVENVREDDPERAALVAVLAQWKRHLGIGARYTAQQIIDHAAGKTYIAARGESLLNARRKRAEFHTALLNVAGHGGFVNNKRLGWWLSQNRNRPVGGVQIVRRGTRGGSTTWALMSDVQTEN
jgi:hypothetical protein